MCLTRLRERCGIEINPPCEGRAKCIDTSSVQAGENLRLDAGENQPAFGQAGKIEANGTSTQSLYKEPSRLCFEAPQCDVPPKRVCCALAVEMRVARLGVDHIAAEKSHDVGLQRVKCPIGRGECHGSAGIDET